MTTNPGSQQLFDAIARATSADIDSRGWAHIRCPECQSEPNLKKTNCSFGQAGDGAYLWHCFSCGAGGSIQNLAARLWVENPLYIAKPERIQKPKRPASWLADGERFVERYTSHPERLARWLDYKKLSAAAIADNRLGFGTLPEYSSRCRWDRLIVPVYDGTILVALRGRWAGCGCCNPKDGKWLAAAGTKTEWLPLYNERALYPGAQVVIVENPVDALLITANSEAVGVATYSTSYWQERWFAALVSSRPARVVVAYDNDLAGNGGGQNRREFIWAWREKNNLYPGGQDDDGREYALDAKKRKVYVPIPAGVKVARLLDKAGLTVNLFPWGNARQGQDFGSFF